MSLQTADYVCSKSKKMSFPPESGKDMLKNRFCTGCGQSALRGTFGDAFDEVHHVAQVVVRGDFPSGIMTLPSFETIGPTKGENCLFSILA